MGALAGGNAAVGAYAGATLGNTLMEYGGQLDRAAEAAGVDPADKDAVMAFIGRGAPGALKNAAVKGAVVGAADMAAMKLGGSILNMGKKAAGKAALEKMGVAAADKAAVAAAKGTPEFAALAKESAKGGLGGAARHAAAYATESAGEFAGEYLGTGLANGEWDEKGAALEAFSSLGHSAVGFAGTKAYAAVTDPLRPPAGRKAGAQGVSGATGRRAGRPRKGRRRCVRRHRRLRTAARNRAARVLIRRITISRIRLCGSLRTVRSRRRRGGFSAALPTAIRRTRRNWRAGRKNSRMFRVSRRRTGRNFWIRA
ncbi:hypothetical protein K6I82_001698 [Neisseria gonorrhoeae]